MLYSANVGNEELVVPNILESKRNVGAIGELSQLVEKIGGNSFDVKFSGNTDDKSDKSDNVFTCLHCAQRFISLEELVQHIALMNHFWKLPITKCDILLVFRFFLFLTPFLN